MFSNQRSSDNYRQLRGRLSDLADSMLDGLGQSPGSTISVVGLTKAITTYPATAKAWYGIDIAYISGDETEGTTASFASKGYPLIRALNLGGNVPPAGTAVKADRGSDGRWTFTF